MSLHRSGVSTRVLGMTAMMSHPVRSTTVTRWPTPIPRASPSAPSPVGSRLVGLVDGPLTAELVAGGR